MILEHGGKASLKDVNKRGLTALGEAILAGHFKLASALTKVKTMLFQSQYSVDLREASVLSDPHQKAQKSIVAENPSGSTCR